MANYAKGIAASGLTPSWPNYAGSSHMWYGQTANVVWQDTSSNATYCNAASCLSS